MITVGQMNTFKVLRKSDLGYMLGHNDEQVLLHFRQSTRELEDNEEIEAFVFFDSKGRLSASLETPNITVDQAAWVTVVDVNEQLGVFIDNNVFKDTLVSRDNLPHDRLMWPQVGDKLYAKLKLRANRLTAKPLNKIDILELHEEIPTYAIGENVSATLIRVSDKAYHALTVDNAYIFIPIKQARGLYRLGQQVDIKILSRRDDEYSASLNVVKENLIDTDAQLIIDYLKKYDTLPLTAKSSSEEIENFFNMSRKAFKRALGGLYKEQKVYFDETNTYLTK